jgi:tetratricopeptide (TPR) repeat protein
LLVTAGRHEEAEQICTKAIDKWPNTANLYMSRARVAVALQKPEKALPDFSKAVELARDTGDAPWWYMERANAYAGLKQDDKALADLTKAIALRPTLWDVWVWRGGFYYSRQQWDKAIADYSKAVELKAPYWPAWHSRGIAYANLKQWEKAIPDYSQAATMNPKDANLHNDLAWLLANCPDAKLRQPARAVEGARKAVELAPKEARFWTTLGVAQYRAGEWKAAIEALTKSMKLSGGGNSVQWFFLAMTHGKLNQRKEAREWYDRAAQWMDKNARDDEELRRVRSEAEELLEIKKKE